LAGKILIGTASWTDKTLIASGKFYPSSAQSAEDRLRFYAENFPIVEVDSTYYFPPSERNAALWADRTPRDFTFHVKAYSLMTLHPTRPNSIPKKLVESIPEEVRSKRFLYAEKLPAKLVEQMWEAFRDALMPLHSSGKLGVIHFQFPKWFLPSNESRDYIREAAERLPDYQIAVEFRNAAWLNERNADRTLAFLHKHAIPYSCVDMPQGFVSSLPPVAEATSKKLAYVRFHGRNEKEWEKQHETATPRFAYKYKQAELEEWVPRLKELTKKTKQVHVLMNNCYRDYAVANARQLATLLDA
jgi:uncharacterized protein YecE (DUF72 family)